jgi:hypothetical protein
LDLAAAGPRCGTGFRTGATRTVPSPPGPCRRRRLRWRPRGPITTSTPPTPPPSGPLSPLLSLLLTMAPPQQVTDSSSPPPPQVIHYCHH